jgi:1,4-alpha-glucan branching enzyme
MTDADVQAIVTGMHGDPFAVLGPHVEPSNGGRALTVRAFLPGARSARLLARPAGGPPAPREMERVHPAGFFEATLPDRSEPLPYALEVTDQDGSTAVVEDAYRFPPTLSDYDLHLFREGRQYRSYEKLGAHPRTVDGVAGVVFAVWAPSARRVSVVGDFNGWDGRRHPMRLHHGVGIWELFIPGLEEGARYKFEVLGPSGELLALKADPHAFAFELETPRTAAVVTRVDRHAWHDGGWMESRGARHRVDSPMAIYEVHLGSWRRVPHEGDRFLTYEEAAEQLGEYVTDMGYTHVELLPVTEHPFYGSWGYQTIGYFAPTRRYGTPEDFAALIDHLHRRGIGVLIDWVPAHFPRDAHGLVYFDGTHLYEHAEARQREHPDWGTLIFNYGRWEVANFLLGNALFWLDRYHVDGLRVDAVASMLYLDYSRRPGEWVPNPYGGNENLDAIAFIKSFNEVVYRYFPDALTVAEESTAWPMVSRPTYLGGLGFGFKWNMGWMHDTLAYMSKDPVYRKWEHNRLTFGLLYAWQENFILPLSHDEVVHGKGSLWQKMPGDDWQKAANLRAYYGFMYGHPGKKLLFMGAEFGQTREWHHDRSLDWHLLDQGPYHRGLQRFVRDLNHLYRGEPALHQLDDQPAGFEWIDGSDAEAGVVAFVRRARSRDDFVVVASNFTPVARPGYRLGVPEPGFYHERLNSDAEAYGGGNAGNAGGVWSEPVPWHGRPHSIAVVLPPLATVVFKPGRG